MGKTAQTFGKISRRSFLGLAGATGVGVALTGCAPAAKQEEPAADSLPVTGGDPLDYDTVSWSSCHVNCGSRCPLKAYVKEGQVVRIDIDSDGDDEFGPGKIYQMRSCVRGRTNRQRIYSPDRIQKPLKRVEGTKRGEGKYEEITWDEAIDLIATTMKEIKEEYGNDAFYIQYGTGVLGGTVSKSWHPDQTMFARLMNLWGGYLRQYADYSTGQITWEMPLFNGDAWSNNEVTDLVNSKNIVLFGNNPANTRMSGSAMQYLLTQVRLQNPEATIVVVDPHLSDTAVGVANRWIPIRPGTDMALVAGMIQYLFSAGKLDEQLIRDKFVGFFSDSFADDVKAAEPTSTAFMGLDKSGKLTIKEDMSYEAYLAGTGAYKGTGEKTPEWAAGITGIPADTIRELADLYMDGPTATIQGWGPQRHSNGGNNSRAIAMIAAITGNVGISGGGTGAREGVGGVPFATPTAIPCFPEKNTVGVCVSFFDWYQAIEDYTVMNDATWGIRAIDETGVTSYAEEPGTLKLRAPIKFIWNYGSNVMMGQHADINDSLRIYNLPDEKDSGVRMIVTVDPWMTPTAMASDIILPGTTPFEEDDLTTGGTAWTGFICCESKAIGLCSRPSPSTRSAPFWPMRSASRTSSPRARPSSTGSSGATTRGRWPATTCPTPSRSSAPPASSSRPTTMSRPSPRRKARSPRPRASTRCSRSRLTTCRASGTSPAAGTCPTTAATRSRACPSGTRTSRATATRCARSTPSSSSATTLRRAPTPPTATCRG